MIGRAAVRLLTAGLLFAAAAGVLRAAEPPAGSPAAQLNGLKPVESAHFLVYHGSGGQPAGGVPNLGGSAAEAGRLSGFLEKAYGALTGALDYPVPDPIRGRRIPVYLFAGMPGAHRGVFSYVGMPLAGQPGVDNPPHLAFAAGIAEPYLKGRAARELFRLFLIGYGFGPDDPTNRWLVDGAAIWVEDEVWDATGPYIGFPRYGGAWWHWWGAGYPFTGVAGPHAGAPHPSGGPGPEAASAFVHQVNRGLWPGNALLFKWWTEHLPGGPGLMREVITGGPKSGDGLVAHLIDVVGRNASEGKDFGHEFLRAALGSFALFGNRPYWLRRGGDVYRFGANFEPAAVPIRERLYHAGHQAGTDRVTPAERVIEPLTAYFGRISGPQRMDDRMPIAMLHLAIHPATAPHVRVGLVERSQEIIDGSRVGPRVALLKPDPSRPGGSWVVPGFMSHRTGWLPYADLVAVNADAGRAGSLKWSFTISGPPTLGHVTIEAGSEDPIYKGGFEGGNLPRGIMTAEEFTSIPIQLTVSRNAVPAADLERSYLLRVAVDLHFSEPVEAPKASLGGKALAADPDWPADGFRSTWRMVADRVDITDEHRKKGEMPLVVETVDKSGDALDTDPRTRAVLSADGTKWQDYDGPGGADTNHHLTIRTHPPYLARIHIEIDAGEEDYYRRVWRRKEGSDQRFVPEFGQSDPDAQWPDFIDEAYEPRQGEKPAGKMFLTFSEIMDAGTVVVFFGKSKLPVEPRGDMKKRGILATIAPEVLAREAQAAAEGSADIQIRVSGTSRAGIPLDGDPKTVVKPDDRPPSRWPGMELVEDWTHNLRVGERLAIVGKLDFSVGGPPVFAHQWVRDHGAEVRRRHVEKHQAIDPVYEGEGNFWFRASGDLDKEEVRLFVGEQRVPLKPIDDRIFVAEKVAAETLLKNAEKGYAQVRIVAYDKKKRSIDTDPASVARRDPEGRREWIDYETGDDKSHRLPLAMAYLKRLRFIPGDKTTPAYDFEWGTASGDARPSQRHADEEVDLEFKGDGLIELTFSMPMDPNTVELLLGGTRVPLHPAPGEPAFASRYDVPVSAATLKKRRKEDEVPIEVRASDRTGRALDAEPASVARPDPENPGNEEAWPGQDTGGDVTHQLRLGGKPPYLARVQFIPGGATSPYYDAEWRPASHPDFRGKKIHVNKPIDPAYKGDGELKLIFSAPMDGSKVGVLLKGTQVRMSAESGGKVFSGMISGPAFEKLATGATIPIEVQARDRNDRPIDGKPQTVAMKEGDAVNDTHHALTVGGGDPFLVSSILTLNEVGTLLPAVTEYMAGGRETLNWEAGGSWDGGGEAALLSASGTVIRGIGLATWLGAEIDPQRDTGTLRGDAAYFAFSQDKEKDNSIFVHIEVFRFSLRPDEMKRVDYAKVLPQFMRDNYGLLPGGGNWQPAGLPFDFAVGVQYCKPNRGCDVGLVAGKGEYMVHGWVTDADDCRENPGIGFGLGQGMLIKVFNKVAGKLPGVRMGRDPDGYVLPGRLPTVTGPSSCVRHQDRERVAIPPAAVPDFRGRQTEEFRGRRLKRRRTGRFN